MLTPPVQWLSHGGVPFDSRSLARLSGVADPEPVPALGTILNGADVDTTILVEALSGHPEYLLDYACWCVELHPTIRVRARPRLGPALMRHLIDEEMVAAIELERRLDTPLTSHVAARVDRVLCKHYL